MKKYIKILFILPIAALVLQGCDGDDSFFADEIFNDASTYPYVSIQDRNEDLNTAFGNNFWNFTLTPEADGTQVRIAYDSQDGNILSHQIYVGLSNTNGAPQDTDALLTTIESFPVELIFTVDQIATALGIPVADLDGDSVYFRGRSTDADSNVVDDAGVFEAFLTFERHAYFYQWPIDTTP